MGVGGGGGGVGEEGCVGVCVGVWWRERVGWGVCVGGGVVGGVGCVGVGGVSGGWCVVCVIG